MNIDERLEALTRNVERRYRDFQDFRETLKGYAVSANREMSVIQCQLRRAIALSVCEARAERAKRRELDEKISQIAAAQQAADEKITQLAAAQLVTEEKLQRFLNSRGGNGKPRSR